MPNNEIRTGKKTNGEFTVTYQQNGYGGCIPVIDGNPEPSLMFGYVSDSDKEACMRLLEEAIRATGGNLWEVRTYIANAVRTSANDIKADEAVMVQDREFLISYTEKKAYLGTEEVANLDDIMLRSIVNYLRHPIVEKLYKSGYQKLAKKVQDGDQIVQNLKEYFLVKSETKQPLFKMLGVNKFVLAAAEQYENLNIIRELKYFFGNEFDISNCPKEIADAVASYVGNDRYHSLVSLIPNANYRR